MLSWLISDVPNDDPGVIGSGPTVPDRTTFADALAVLKDQRNNLAEALAQLGKFSALAADSVNQTKDALVQELKDLGPVLESLANAGPALTRALSSISTSPTHSAT